MGWTGLAQVLLEMPVGHLPGVSELRGGTYGISPAQAGCHGTLKSESILSLACLSAADVLMEWEVRLWDVAVRWRVAWSWNLTSRWALSCIKGGALLVRYPRCLFTDSRTILRPSLSPRGACWCGRGVGSADERGVGDIRPWARGRLWQLASITSSTGLWSWMDGAAWCVYLQISQK